MSHDARKMVFGSSDLVLHKLGCTVRERFGKKRNCTILVVKTNALTSITVSAKLICVCFRIAKNLVSHDVAHIISMIFTAGKEN